MLSAEQVKQIDDLYEQAVKASRVEWAGHPAQITAAKDMFELWPTMREMARQGTLGHLV